MPRIEHDGTVYNFIRFANGEGNWCENNKIVYIALQSELSKMARAAGVSESHGFSRFPPKPVKEKAIRVKGERKARSANKGKFSVKLKLGQIRVGA